MNTEISFAQENEVECCPIKTFEGALNWRPSLLKHRTEPLHNRLFDENVPRTLVCHDMKGGYLNDRFLNGCDEDNCYNFIHWSIIDTFVYFSHHLITIPPCGWITAAHKNGTSILGTFITEWEEGANICERFLENKECVNQMCNQLVDIASFYGFDGWLVNIENKIQIHQVQLLKEFVSSLTKKMHMANPHAFVIWYDSVIETGELKWQNCLNEHNRDFFLACDGIFLNYGWTLHDLEQTVVEAGSRKMDVYVGVDVFGRNKRGKVGFDVPHAIKPARDHGLSIAIFAPGWVYETLPQENFWENQHIFWEPIAELCFPHTFKSLPFSTTFCPGQGRKMYRRGMAIKNAPWINLSLQQPQPLCHQGDSSESSARICIDDAYSGGGCLELAGILDKNCNMIFCIFSSHFEIEDSCVISYTFKKSTEDVSAFSLFLNMLSREGEYMLCLGDKDEMSSIKCQMFPSEAVTLGSSKAMKIEYPITSDQFIKDKQSFHPVTHEYGGWVKRTYFLKAYDYKHHIIRGINACISDELSETARPYCILLGELKIDPQCEEKTFFTFKDFKITKENNSINLQCFLEWNCKPNVYSWDIFYKFNGICRYMCTTNQTFYRIDNLNLLPNDTASVPEYPIETLFNFSGNSYNGDPHIDNQIEFFLNYNSGSYIALETKVLKIHFNLPQ